MRQSLFSIVHLPFEQQTRSWNTSATFRPFSDHHIWIIRVHHMKDNIFYLKMKFLSLAPDSDFTFTVDKIPRNIFVVSTFYPAKSSLTLQLVLKSVFMSYTETAFLILLIRMNSLIHSKRCFEAI